ncbi:MAG: hypothetical protein KF791_17780 [Verrucomicrobiae bacterium]|nr:hypothetical protein [Verrucomicrobiae bacterium]
MDDSLEKFADDLQAVIRRGPAAWEDVFGQDDSFARQALRLFRLQRDRNQTYRAGFFTPGPGPDDWRRIPAVPAAAFKERDLTAIPAGQRSRTFFSSGTTAQVPSRHHHHPASLALYEASLWAWFQRHLLPEIGAPRLPPWQVVSLTPRVPEAPHSSLAHMFTCVAEHLNRRGAGPGEPTFHGRVDGQGGWRLEVEAVVASLEQAVATGRPVLLLGTAFNHVHLLDHLAAVGRRFELAPGSRVLETGGYKGRSRELARPELHHALTDILGVPPAWIVGEYGMSELSSQGYDRVAGRTVPRRFQMPPWARAWVVSPEDGREVPDGGSGLLRLMDLANVWSVLAIQTEDLAVRRGGAFELVGRAPSAEPRGCSLRSIGEN